MTETQPRGVQEMTLRRQRYDLPPTAATVRVVTDDRMPDRGQVHADLVRSPGVQVRAQQVHRVEARQPDERRLRRLSGLHDGHPPAIARVACERLLDR